MSYSELRQTGKWIMKVKVWCELETVDNEWPVLKGSVYITPDDILRNMQLSPILYTSLWYANNWNKTVLFLTFLDL